MLDMALVTVRLKPDTTGDDEGQTSSVPLEI